MDAADTYDRVSAKASPDGSSLDTPDEFIVFSRKVERVDLADWREIEHFVSVNHWEESK
ncbi:hypothetical protein FA95DRAFT_1562704 [Auriscalpium vulgare]|uniref:Uncharacterized protein n=1 Tax=Auriscalpium vulgare TaxID=40419 RepID=A0ACB8RIJ8_9AGAM|nr:hypothetical protein FA95DRAFT_1562704 [Auriscalpium vulgare]